MLVSDSRGSIGRGGSGGAAEGGAPTLTLCEIWSCCGGGTGKLYVTPLPEEVIVVGEPPSGPPSEAVLARSNVRAGLVSTERMLAKAPEEGGGTVVG